MGNYQFSRLKALLVEDNEFMSLIVHRMLTGFGVGEIRVKREGAEALQELQLFAPDLILTDCMMAPVNGIEFVLEVRNAEGSPNPYVPIIMITGYTELHRVQEARDAGVTEMLVKPFSALSLAQRIQAIVERPRQFIRTHAFFGPDRRRRRDPNYDGPERRIADPGAVVDRGTAAPPAGGGG
jgi:two-component system, chemotaxis family, chemotaxis protein CheY